MKSIVKTALIPLFIMGVFSACNNANSTNSNTAQAVSPDLVTNPATASGKKVKSKLPVMEFKTNKHDFGLIMQGEKVSHTFKFKNVGGSDLVISSASSTCGCTVSSFSKEPIKPGEEGEVEVIFNSTGKKGSNNKAVKLLTNAQPNTIQLTITAEVYVPKKK
ncbi:MAG: DUF1573 domain-containing protein [Bacteroidales bacterium]|nr:DUF1573 domain-containing protein [Bacteroidales bacterium]